MTNKLITKIITFSIFSISLYAQGDIEKITSDSTNLSFTGSQVSFAHFNSSQANVLVEIPVDIFGQNIPSFWVHQVYDLNTLNKIEENNLFEVDLGISSISTVIPGSLSNAGFYFNLHISAPNERTLLLVYDSTGTEIWRKQNYSILDKFSIPESKSTFKQKDLLTIDSSGDLVLFATNAGIIYQYDRDSLLAQIRTRFYPNVDSLEILSRNASDGLVNDEFTLSIWSSGINALALATFDRSFNLVDSISYNSNAFIGLNQLGELCQIYETTTANSTSPFYSRKYEFYTLDGLLSQTFNTNGYWVEIFNQPRALESIKPQDSSGYYTVNSEVFVYVYNNGNIDSVTVDRLRFFNQQNAPILDHRIYWNGIPGINFSVGINREQEFYRNPAGEYFAFIKVGRYLSSNFQVAYLLKIDSLGQSPLTTSTFLEDLMDISVFPTVFDDEINFTSNSELSEIQIKSITGKIVYKSVNLDLQGIINTSHFAKGNYILIAQSKLGSIKNFKIVKD